MPSDFQFDAFLSHSAKDKAVVRPLAGGVSVSQIIDVSYCAVAMSRIPFSNTSFASGPR